MRSRPAAPILAAAHLVLCVLAGACSTTAPKPAAGSDPYAAYVWPPPPDDARIRLVQILVGRADVEAVGSFGSVLFGASPQEQLDRLKKPFAVAYDAQGRLLVTDQQLGALVRFDRSAHRYDVMGTRGVLRLAWPLGLGLGPDGRIYVADPKLRKVVVFSPDGDTLTAFGREGELENPTDAAVSPDGKTLFVADSKAHAIVVFDVATSRKLRRFGTRGSEEGTFNYPSALAFGRDGNLYVVDQINSRIQLFAPDGTFLDSFGALGTDYGSFVRPKDVAIDAHGWIYVTDAAFNNVQIFDEKGRLLTFVGSGGDGPGQFNNLAGVDVRGDEFALVDQINARVEVFRYLSPRAGEKPAP